MIDCHGDYVSPGFVDIHQHGGGGSDYMDNDPDAYYNAILAHLCHGTTSVMPTLLSAEKAATLQAVAAYKAAEKDARIEANLIGLHIEGPYISPQQAGAQKPEHIRTFDEAEYRQIVQAAGGSVKRWSVAPEVAGAEAFAKFAGDNGITLSIAHTNADFETVLRAFDLGYRHITHFYSCMSTVTRRNGFRAAGAIEAAYFLDDMNVEIIADGCHLPETLLRYITKFKAWDHIALVTGAMRAAGQNVERSYLGSMNDPLPVIIEDGVAKLEDRTAFGGSIATADRLIRNMVGIGVPLVNAVKMMTVNPLNMMDLDIKKGKLLPGWDADICIFNEDIRIQKVFSGGKLVVDNIE